MPYAETDHSKVPALKIEKSDRVKFVSDVFLDKIFVRFPSSTFERVKL